MKKRIFKIVKPRKDKLSLTGKINSIKIIGFLLIGVIVVQMINLSVVQYDAFVDKAQKQQISRVTIPANRGTIYDRNMEVLAQSATVWSVIFSPLDIKNEQKELIATSLSKILSMEKDVLTKKLNKKNRYEIVKTKVEKPIIDELRLFITENQAYGINIQEDTKRYYPNNNSAAAVIGFTGSDNQGQYGLELYYNSYLSGTPGYKVSAKDGYGGNLPTTYENKVAPVNGNNLVLTIDENIQGFVESALDEAIMIHNPTGGAAGIAMNPKTGEIYAMASKGDFDLNSPREIKDPKVLESLEKIKTEEGEKAYLDAFSKAQQAQWFNKAISYAYQPGSVFKPITGSASLEEKTTSLGQTHYCPGYIIVADRTMRCHQSGGHGVVDFRGSMVGSCNPAFVEMGQSLGANNFYKYLKAYGLTEKTGIDLPGEGVSMYYTPSSLGTVELASCSFGQSTAVTPIQMITAFAAVINGGNLVTPYLVKDILDENNNIIKTTTPQIKRQVISKETSLVMQDILESVVSAKGGSNAYIKGYQIGGKSGTSQKQGPADNKEAKISSYCSFAPANDPEAIVLIMVDEPTSGQIYGSIVAGPVSADIMGELLPYLGVEKKYTDEELESLESIVPHVVDKDTLFAKGAMSANGLESRVIGEGKNVVKQVPAVGSKVLGGSCVILYTEDVKETTTIVPNVVGLTPFEANRLLTNAGLCVLIHGGAANNKQAKVTVQSVEKGEVVGIGTVVEITSLKSDSD